MQFLGDWLHDGNLWHINRRSTSGAFALGLFCAFLPIPTQMIFAALGAVIFRVNILISVVLVWITNPLTIAPIYYFCYRVGLFILDTEEIDWKWEWSWSAISELSAVWKPLVVGSFSVSTMSAIAGFVLIRIIWRLSILQRIRQKRQRRQSS